MLRFRKQSASAGWEEAQPIGRRPGVALGGAAHQDRPVGHPRAGRDAVVLAPIEQDILVHLVGIDPDVRPAALPDHGGDLLELGLRGHPARGLDGNRDR